MSVDLFHKNLSDPDGRIGSEAVSVDWDWKDPGDMASCFLLCLPMKSFNSWMIVLP